MVVKAMVVATTMSCTFDGTAVETEHCRKISYGIVEGNLDVIKKVFKTTVSNSIETPIIDEIRECYNRELLAKGDEFLQHAKKTHANMQCIIPYDIERVVLDREKIKKFYRDKTPFLGRIGIYVRNFFKYGNVYGPSLDYLVAKVNNYDAKGKTVEEIGYSAVKNDGSDLGLNSNGNKDIYDVYMYLKEYLGEPEKTGYYMEAISQEEASCFKANMGHRYLLSKWLKKAIACCNIKGLYDDSPLR